ncbi:MAG: rhomboid family intramembrane serine protease [Fimbriimonadales bacterium]|nr:MAG: rhomboid family intramembrane serine protease [Fimbriimonadales bacterium]
MLPLRDDSTNGQIPFVTWTIGILLVVIYVWDRQGAIFGPPYAFADLAARPQNVLEAFRGGSKEPLVTLFTSMFLHGSVWHIVGNLVFLKVFGPRVEEAFGPLRFALYYLFFGIVATMTHVLVMPHSTTALVGASGAIAGIMGVYFLFYPAARIETIVFPIYWIPFVLPAWAWLSLWFLYQLFAIQPGVATWAHVGGFLAGMLIAILVGKEPKSIPEYEKGMEW